MQISARNTSSMNNDERLLSHNKYLFAKAVYENPGNIFKIDHLLCNRFEDFSKLSKQKSADKFACL